MDSESKVIKQKLRGRSNESLVERRRFSDFHGRVEEKKMKQNLSRTHSTIEIFQSVTSIFFDNGSIFIAIERR